MFGFGKKKKENSLELVRNWYTDRYQIVVVQRNILTLITLLALLGLAGAVFAVAKISQSRTFEPYVIEVEKTTGITTLVDRNSIEQFQANEMIKRYFVFHYIQSREGYDVNTYNYNYAQVVRVLSSGEVYSAFNKSIAISNPASPVNLGRGASREVKLKSMTFLGPKMVQVRAVINEVKVSDGQATPHHVIITLGFDFVPLELTTEERYINPLNFQVVSYRIDEDTP